MGVSHVPGRRAAWICDAGVSRRRSALIALRLLQGTGAGRRIWRRRHVRGRTRTAQPPRRIHLLDPDHCDSGPVPVADGDPRHAHRTGRRQPSRPGAGAFRSWCRSCCSRSASGSGCRWQESPVFQSMKDEGRTSKAPLKESFGRWTNLKLVILALAWTYGGAGRGLVHGPVLCPVLPDADVEDRRRDRQPPGGGGPC